MPHPAIEPVPEDEPRERTVTGYVARKRDDKGYGFLRDGTPAKPGLREWYFHSRDLVDAPFVSLVVGDAMVFTPDDQPPTSKESPRAVKVRRR